MSATLLVIGAGRVGQVLARHPGSVLVRREGPWAALGGPGDAPVVVATRNDDLDAVLAKVPEHARSRLVFVQNGVLDAVLARHGLAGPGGGEGIPVTLGVLYFAAAARDGRAVGGRPSLFCGPRAEAMRAVLEGLGLPAQVLAPRPFRRELGVKLAWNAVLGLLGELEWRGDRDARAAVVLAARSAELDALAEELRPVIAAGLGEDPGDLAAPLRSYTASIPDFPLRLKELPWRNGLVRGWARVHGLPTPTHDALLDAIEHPRPAG